MVPTIDKGTVAAVVVVVVVVVRHNTHDNERPEEEAPKTTHMDSFGAQVTTAIKITTF
jgi:hypothetical protein